MEDLKILVYVDGALILALAVAVARMAYAAGLLTQTVSDLKEEHKRLRDRLDKFLDPQQHYEGRGGC